MLKDSPSTQTNPAKINKEDLIAKLVQALSAKPEIIFAYLFGSVAKGTAGIFTNEQSVNTLILNLR